MNKPHDIADRHRRMRQDHATETAEDYVRAVHRLEQSQGRCRVTDLARTFGISHVTVTKIIARLKRERLVHNEPYGPIGLTAAGRELAEKSQRQHSIVFGFLCAAGVCAEVAAIDAEGIEHHVSLETLECFRRLTKLLERNRGGKSSMERRAENKPTKCPVAPTLLLKDRERVA